MRQVFSTTSFYEDNTSENLQQPNMSLKLGKKLARGKAFLED